MAHGKSVVRCLVALVAAFLLVSQPAEARRRGFFVIPGFGGGETIDPVYDLPDRDPFVKDGKFMDVGWLNGRSSSGYVLYNGDRYVRLDPSGISALNGVLGFDPTAAHKAQQAPAIAKQEAADKAERAHQDKLVASGRLLKRRDGETDEEFAQRKQEFVARARSSSANNAQGSSMPEKSTGGGLGFWTILLLVVGLGAIVKKLFGRRSSVESSDPFATQHEAAPETTESKMDTASFDAKIAARLGLIGQGSQGEPQHSSAQGAVARGGGFGRKGMTPSGSLG